MSEKPLTPDPSLRIIYRPILQQAFNLSHVETIIAGYLIGEWNLSHDEDRHIKVLMLKHVAINTVTSEGEVVKALGSLQECPAFSRLFLLHGASIMGDIWVAYEAEYEYADDFMGSDSDEQAQGEPCE